MAITKRKRRTATKSTRKVASAPIKRKKRRTRKNAFRKSDVGKRVGKVEAPRGFKKSITALGALVHTNNAQCEFLVTMLKDYTQRQMLINARCETLIAEFEHANKNARH